MLLDGFNHVAVLTSDTDRFVTFYTDVFGAEVRTTMPAGPGATLTILMVGDHAEINLFEVADNTEAQRQVPMFGRGRLDHLALQAASLDDFSTIRDRLVERGSSDGFVTDFGPILSVFFRDPDGLEAEVCVGNPDWEPGVFNPPGTPSTRFHPA